MEYRVTFKQPWRYRHPSKGYRLVEPGVYSVPEQMPLSSAQLAVDQGMATMIKIEPPDGCRVFNESDLELVSEVEFDRSAEQKPRRKGRPPKNKSLGRAPEDKSSLV